MMTRAMRGTERFNEGFELSVALRCCSISRAKTVSELSFVFIVFVRLGLGLVVA